MRPLSQSTAKPHPHAKPHPAKFLDCFFVADRRACFFCVASPRLSKRLAGNDRARGELSNAAIGSSNTALDREISAVNAGRSGYAHHDLVLSCPVLHEGTLNITATYCTTRTWCPYLISISISPNNNLFLAAAAVKGGRIGGPNGLSPRDQHAFARQQWVIMAYFKEQLFLVRNKLQESSIRAS
jgi:hypothetical protein